MQMIRKCLIVVSVLLLSGTALLATPAHAQVPTYRLVTKVTFSNQNWYPLPVKDMKAAAVDPALSELSSAGMFSLVDAGDSDKTRTGFGALKLDVSLVEAAQICKITITLQAPDRATFVSSASTSLKDMDYQGIYRAFESVGVEAAKRLREKVAVQRQLDRVATPPAPVATTKAANEADAEATRNALARKLYEYAQQLKRENEFNKARAAFERVASTHEVGGAQWKALSRDELNYGLLTFEAKYWLLQLGSGTADPTKINAAINNAERLYREVVALNGANLERTTEAHRELDTLIVSRRAIGNVLRQTVVNRAMPVRMMLREYYLMEGFWPDEKTFRDMLRDVPAGIEIAKYVRTAQGMDARLTDKKTAKKIRIIGTNDSNDPLTVEVE